MESDGEIRPYVGGRLNSWKEIAAYFHRGVTTVQRWEREEGLPVHRLTHESGNSVYAYENELARWHAMRSRRAGEPATDETGVEPAPPVMPRLWRPFAAAVAACVAALSIWHLWPGKIEASALHVVPVAATEVMEMEPDVSRDGKLVVYVARSERNRDGWRLIVKPLHSNETRTVWSGPARPQFPQWSRDGRRVLFSQIEGRKVEIAILDTAGGSVRTLVKMEDPAYEHQRAVRWAVWDAGDRTIVVSRMKAGGSPYALYRYSLDGKELARLTRPAHGTAGDQQAAVSPDGSEIAFVRYRRPTESDIFVINAAGGEPRQVTKDSGLHHGLAWTPEGSYLIYGARAHSPASNLWRMASTGGNPKPLTLSDTNASWPSVAISPDGASAIAYQKSQVTVNVMHWERPELGGEGKAACPSSYFEASTQFSPDGMKLAYESRRGGTSEIWTCDLRTGRAMQLTNNGGPITDSPRWSPDGQTISFTTFAGGSRNIYIADVASKAVRTLIAEPADEGRASWSRDGRWIYFRSDRGGQADLWKMPASGGVPVRITTTGAFEGFESADGKRLYFTRSRRSPGLWSVNAGGGGERFETADVREGWWAVTTKGILFLPASRFRELWRYDPAMGRREMVRRLAPEAASVWTGFAARWDGGAVAWSQTTIDIQDIVMLQGVLF